MPHEEWGFVKMTAKVIRISELDKPFDYYYFKGDRAKGTGNSEQDLGT
jgi:hypothetical protein